jgi:hypothetical protein
MNPYYPALLPSSKSMKNLIKLVTGYYRVIEYLYIKGKVVRIGRNIYIYLYKGIEVHHPSYPKTLTRC